MRIFQHIGASLREYALRERRRWEPVARAAVSWGLRGPSLFPPSGKGRCREAPECALFMPASSKTV